MKLLTDGDNVYKIRKSNKAELGYRTAIMYLAPEKTSGIGNTCPFASLGCKLSCLFTAGRGGMHSVQQARVNRTLFYYNNRKDFLTQLNLEIERFIRKCDKLEQIPTFRLDGTSDIGWHNHINMAAYSEAQFYDYTKSTKRMADFMAGRLPENYHLTFSRSEINESEAIAIKRDGGNVAVVFKPADKRIKMKDFVLPERWKRFKTFSADSTDLRFLDPMRGIAALTAKGKAKKDTTGFVVSV